MSRRVLAIVMASLFLFLAACGNDSSSTGASDGKVTVTGDFGAAPTVKYSSDFAADAVTTKVVIEGDGEKIAKDDKVNANLTISTPQTAEGQAFTTFGAEPMMLDNSQGLPPMFEDVLTGHTYGSRVLVTASAKKGFGEGGNPQLGVGNADSVAMVVDLVDKYVPTKEELAAQTPVKPIDVAADKMPAIGEKKGKVTNLFFKGIKKPKADGKLLRHVVKEGDGAVVTPDMTIKVNYYGETWMAKAPFDESYTKEPVEFPLTGVVKGWTDGLTGVKVGSRVLLTIPPSLGYGDQEQSTIPANSTLYFVVDVLSAKPTPQ